MSEQDQAQGGFPHNKSGTMPEPDLPAGDKHPPSPGEDGDRVTEEGVAGQGLGQISGGRAGGRNSRSSQ